MPDRNEVETARHLRRNATWAEKVAWELLRDRRCCGAKFRRQQALVGFIVDFYCSELKLVIEIDGEVHDDAAHRARDALRTAELEALGLRVVRIRNEDVNAVTLEKFIQRAMQRPLSVRQDGEGVGG